MKGLGQVYEIWNSPFYYIFMCPKYCCLYGKQWDPDQMPRLASSDLDLYCLQSGVQRRLIWVYTVCKAVFSGFWSGFILFAKTYLSQYLGSFRYTSNYSTLSNDFGSEQWRPWSDCAHMQTDLGLRCQHICAETHFPMAVLTDGPLLKTFAMTTYSVQYPLIQY